MESMSWGELEDDFQEDFNEASRPYDEDRLERGNFRAPAAELDACSSAGRRREFSAENERLAAECVMMRYNKCIVKNKKQKNKN